MSKASWPRAVVRAASEGSLVLVVGAGVSASCQNVDHVSPPDWLSLLRCLSNVVSLGRDGRAEFESLVNSGRLLDAAELLKYSAREKSRLADFTQAMKEAVQGPNGKPFRESNWHRAIADINPQVIITTNYDKIIENAASLDYMVSTYYGDELDAQVRSGESLLLKIHGSVDSPGGMILTRSDYGRLWREGRLALDVLRALMLTRTLLFVGYSLSDPDLQALLQEVFAARPHENVSPHYILMADSVMGHEREKLRYCYGVTPVEYSSGVDFGLGAFRELGEEVAANV